MNPATKNFLQLFFDAIDENIQQVIRELKEEGIDTEESENRIKIMIKKKKAELKIERGKILKEKVEEILKAQPEETKSETIEERYSIAARKLGSLDQEDILSIKKDAELLK
ncbi:MAG: hypothetical protein RBR74_05580, partial [Ignavibacteriaceae bacterium]|nr:hypothetical protein [Ignavibacteriaceae bacterium]